MNDRIEKQIELEAPISRVWTAITDYRQFGEWFQVRLDSPFVPGKTSSGRITHPGYEHVRLELIVQKIEPERLFSFTWSHPRFLDPARYSPDTSDPTTLVEFTLEKTANGTLLTITEAGFAKFPADFRNEAFKRNQGGWEGQLKNIENYVTDRP